MVWVDLGKFNLTAGAGVVVLNPDNPTLAGDVTASLAPVAAVPF